MKEKLFKKRHEDIVHQVESLNTVRMRYPDAMKNKTLLTGVVSKDGVDWTHHDFLLATVVWKKCNTLMDVVHEMWYNLWPYLDNLIRAYVETKNMLVQQWNEEDALLKKYAEAETDRKLRAEFLKQQGMEDDYQNFKQKFPSVRRDIQKDACEEAEKNTRPLPLH